MKILNRYTREPRRRADLHGANLEEGEIVSFVASGELLDYHWIAWRMADKRVLLRYGCETRYLDAWPGEIDALCEKHANGDNHYPPALRALIAFVSEIKKGR